MINIEVKIAVEDCMLLDAFSNWVERNCIECKKIHGGHDLCFELSSEDFNSFTYEYFLIKVNT